MSARAARPGRARFPPGPTRRTTTPGVKGYRARVGTRDNQDRLYGFAALNPVSGRPTTRLPDSPARIGAATGRSEVRRPRAACPAHLTCPAWSVQAQR